MEIGRNREAEDDAEQLRLVLHGQQRGVVDALGEQVEGVEGGIHQTRHPISDISI